MKYLIPLLTLILVSCTAVKVTPREIVQTRPYPAVGVLYRDGWAICTLTLIDERVVLTAAHCVATLGNYTVGLGSDHYAVADITPHPAWDGHWIGDIALLTLGSSPPITPIPHARTPVSLTDFAKRIVIVGRATPKVLWEDFWIVGSLGGTDMIMWPDATNWIKYGDSGGPVLWDGCVGGVTHGYFYDNKVQPRWTLGLSTDVGIFTEWIDDYIGESGT